MPYQIWKCFKEKGKNIENVWDTFIIIFITILHHHWPALGRLVNMATRMTSRKVCRWSFSSLNRVISLKELRTGLSKICHFGTQIILSNTIQTLQAQKIFCPSLHDLEKSKLGALPIMRVLTRNNFLWPIYRAGQTFNYWTSALLIP